MGLTSTRMFCFCSPPPQPKQCSSSLCARVPPPSSSSNNRDICVAALPCSPSATLQPCSGQGPPRPAAVAIPHGYAHHGSLALLCLPAWVPILRMGCGTTNDGDVLHDASGCSRPHAVHGSSWALRGHAAPSDLREGLLPGAWAALVPWVSVVWAAGEAMRGCMTYIEHEALFVHCASSARQSPYRCTGRREGNDGRLFREGACVHGFGMRWMDKWLHTVVQFPSQRPHRTPDPSEDDPQPSPRGRVCVQPQASSMRPLRCRLHTSSARRSSSLPRAAARRPLRTLAAAAPEGSPLQSSQMLVRPLSAAFVVCTHAE